MKPPTFRNGICDTHFAPFWTARMCFCVATVLRAASRDVAWSTLPHRPATQRWTAVVTQHLFHRMLEALPIGVIVFPGTGVQGISRQSPAARHPGLALHQGRRHLGVVPPSHLSIIKCAYRAAGEDARARRARWIMLPCLLLMRSGSNHGQGAVKSFPATRMRRLWARYRSIEWPRHVGVRSARYHARTPIGP
jgi:hypothetical protein